jgi:hypothetical protein
MPRLFNRFIANLLPKLKWRHFGVGALQAYLHEGEHAEQRLHIWHHGLIRPGILGHGDCHDHRFSFVSEVLCGAIDNEEWFVEEHPKGDYDLYEVENARAAHARLGSHDGDAVAVARCYAGPLQRTLVVDGKSYEFARGSFHRSSCIGLTVTLVTKFDQRSDVRARILCPHGKPLVHAFGGPEPDVQTVLRDAQEALCR